MTELHGLLYKVFAFLHKNFKEHIKYLYIYIYVGARKLKAQANSER